MLYKYVFINVKCQNCLIKQSFLFMQYDINEEIVYSALI